MGGKNCFFKTILKMSNNNMRNEQFQISFRTTTLYLKTNIKFYRTCESLKKLKRRTSSNSSPLAQSMVKTRHFWNVDFTVFFVSSLVTRTTWCAPRSIFDVSLSFPLNNKWRFLQMSKWINRKTLYSLHALKSTIFFNLQQKDFYIGVVVISFFE